MPRPLPHHQRLPDRAAGMWVAQTPLSFPGRTVAPEEDAPEVFDLREASIRGLWQLGRVRFERYRDASAEAQEREALASECVELRRERDRLAREVERLSAIAQAGRPKVAALFELVESIREIRSTPEPEPAPAKKRGRPRKEASA